MKPGSMLINVARGPLVVETRSGRRACNRATWPAPGWT